MSTYVMVVRFTADDDDQANDAVGVVNATLPFVVDNLDTTMSAAMLAEFFDAVDAAEEAADGDSNDAEILTLQEAVSAAQALLGSRP